MTTYLKTVVARLLLDFRSQTWGRWRPSTRARALGADALALERLVHRDGYRLSEAVQILRVSRGDSLSEAEIERLWVQLPERTPKWMTSDVTPIDLLADPHPATDLLSDAEDAAAASRALARALEILTPADRMLLQLHFARGVPLVRLARMWDISRATVMRRLGRALTTCRKALLGAGMGSHRLLELVRTGAVDLLLLDPGETLAGRGRLIRKDAAKE